MNTIQAPKKPGGWSAKGQSIDAVIQWVKHDIAKRKDRALNMGTNLRERKKPEEYEVVPRAVHM